MKAAHVKEETANNFVNVADIKEFYIITKDNFLIGFLHMGNINLDLLSPQDVRLKTSMLVSQYREERSAFSYMTLPREVDLDVNKRFLQKKIKQEVDNAGKRRLLQMMLAEETALSSDGSNFEHQHFLKCWEAIENKDIQRAKKKLLEKLSLFRERYKTVGIEAPLLYEKDIIKLCNMHGNVMAYIKPEEVEIPLFEKVPRLRDDF